ncbi:iron-containing alcohol dehydrogenase [Streptomyces lincolnensis]|nr:iron-containing alcohol dehydrogenase [Streptomyces lincolnensis]
MKQQIPLDGHDVPYMCGIDCADTVAELVAASAGAADSVLFVMDGAVASHAAPVISRLSEHLRTETVQVVATESNKTLSLVGDIAEFAVSRGVTRGSVVVGMGGGMVGNVAGLTAALLFRGTRLIHLPTTPVAAFDSVVSVKQAVNLRGGKNLSGTYYAPSLIACDLRWLETVPPEQLRTGLSEMVKNVLAVIPEQWDTLMHALAAVSEGRTTEALPHLFDIGVTAKVPFLGRDPRERKEALVFEYGHTMGHALELASRGAMKHGEAVAWGMLVAAEVSHRLGFLTGEDLRSHYRIIDRLELPPARARIGAIDPMALEALLSTDNKRGYLRCADDEVAMVLLQSLGNPLVTGGSGYPLVPVRRGTLMSALHTVTEHIPEERSARWKKSSLS